MQDELGWDGIERLMQKWMGHRDGGGHYAVIGCYLNSSL